MGLVDLGDLEDDRDFDLEDARERDLLSFNVMGVFLGAGFFLGRLFRAEEEEDFLGVSVTKVSVCVTCLTLGLVPVLFSGSL